MDKDKKPFPIFEWAKAICYIIVTAVIGLKVYSTPTTITVDFPTLLSLLLALFSVGLSALFYFKATDTSNAFYDNTYKFTKDIAELLIKIESGFGERLKHLDEGYSSMRSYLQNSGSRGVQDVDETKQKLASEKQEIEKVRSERNEIVEKLIEQSALAQEEKDSIAAELKKKEEELLQSQAQLTKLNRHLTIERVSRRRERSEDLDSGMTGYTRDNVLPKIGRVMKIPSTAVKTNFNGLINKLPRGYIEDLERHGYFENGLTSKGVSFLRRMEEVLSGE